ncbi:MAG: hypothetical protein KDA25_03095 [Phycisphaerales bacterium]|nr:hypothetical protein [Phycisphaerales bacterium]
MMQRFTIVSAAMLVFVLAACSSSPKPKKKVVPPPPPPTQVVVLGTIHGQHRTSELYGTAQLSEMIRQLRPTRVLCEIPPDRFMVALDEFERTGTVTEARVSQFPEYVDVLFPLTKEMDFDIIPCAAWTQAMSDERAAALARLRTERPEDSATVQEAQQQAERRIAAGGDPNDPRWIHTRPYDDIVRAGMTPYAALFDVDLGAGGWTAINEAHWALLSAALDDAKDTGERVVIMFGAWHKYWILDRLHERPDVLVIDPIRFMP